MTIIAIKFLSIPDLSVRFFGFGTTLADQIEHDENHDKENPRSG